MERSELPEGWVRASVCDVGTVVTGNTPSTQNPSNYGSQIPFVKPPQLNDLPIGATREFLSELGAQSARVLPPFSILVSCIGNLGKTGLNKAPVAFNQQINAIVPSGDISPLFLFYQVQSHDFRSQLEAKATATTISIVNKGNFETVKLNVAPLAEQHRIVAKIEELFSELDQGVASLKTAREQIKVYRQSLLKNAFEGKLSAAWRAAHTDQLETAAALQQRIARERQARHQQQLADWQTAGQAGPKPKPPKPLPPLTAEELAELPELPEGWGWVKTGDLGTLGTGVTPLKSRTDFYAGGTIPWVTSGALNASYVTEASDYITPVALRETNLRLYPKHALLVALYGEGKTRGKCSELLIEATTNQAIAAIVLDGTAAILRPYVKWFFQKNYGDIRLKSAGGVQPNLNLGIIENTVVPLCSLAEAAQLVETIESKLSEADQLDQTLATALQQADALRQSILKKAFHGQLVKQDKNEEPATALLERIRAAQGTAKPPPGVRGRKPKSNVQNLHIAFNDPEIPDSSFAGHQE